MNFIDAAVAVLRKSGRPLHVEEISRLAVEQELLTRPGKTPVSTMKGRLTTELKKGEDSQVERVEANVWALRGAAAQAAPKRARKNTPHRAATATGGAGRAKAGAAGRKARPKPAAAAPAAAPPEAAPAAAPPEAAPAAAPPEAAPAAAPPEESAAPVSAEEQAFAALYEEELDGTVPIADLTEYRDERTADEDRPLLPEIVARRGGRRDRRGRRERGTRTASDGETRSRPAAAGETRSRPAAAPVAEAQPAVERAAPEPAAAPQVDGAREAAAAPARRYRPGNRIADAAHEALSSVKSGQPIQVKQLAQMMRKRRLLDDDPNRAWPAVKAALLADERAHRSRGLRPRVVYRGRDLFAVEDRDLDDDLAAAETALEEAIIRHEVATHRALARRLSGLALPALERVAQIYLESIGWRDIEWIKRVGRSGYAVAAPVALPGPVLVGVRCGDEPVDRRGVGELRAGLEAKDLPLGMLIAPRDLSDGAAAELARGGRPVTVLCGDAFTSALVTAAVGVVAAAAPVRYLDTEFFAEITSE